MRIMVIYPPDEAVKPEQKFVIETVAEEVQAALDEASPSQRLALLPRGPVLRFSPSRPTHGSTSSIADPSNNGGTPSFLFLRLFPWPGETIDIKICSHMDRKLSEVIKDRGS